MTIVAKEDGRLQSVEQRELGKLTPIHRFSAAPPDSAASELPETLQAYPASQLFSLTLLLRFSQ